MARNSLKNNAIELNTAKHYIEMCLRSNKRQKVFCLVEGELDKRVYQKNLNDTDIEVCIAHDEHNKAGYARVMKYVAELRSDNSSARVIGIRDKDYSIILGHLYPDGIFHTDCRDIEMMILSSQSFRESDDTIQEKMESVCQYCRHLAYLRIYNEEQGAIFKFNKLVRVSLVYDANNHQYYNDWKSCLNRAYIAKVQSSCSHDQIDTFITERNLESYKDTDICRGHDVISLLGIVYGNQYHKEVIENKMYDNYSSEDFYTSNLFSCIQSYCSNFEIDARVKIN